MASSRNQQLVRSSSSSSTSSNNLTMKLLVDRDSQRLVYGLAEKDVVDFLFGLLGSPVSTVVPMLTRDPMAGCIRNLYRSVDTLPDRYICHRNARAAKDALLRPTAAGCPTGLLLLLTDASATYSNGHRSTHRSGFVEEAYYTVTDNLKIAREDSVSTTAMISTSGCNVRSLRERIVTLDHNVGLQILRVSLQSNTVLTDVFLRGSSRRALTPT